MQIYIGQDELLDNQLSIPAKTVSVTNVLGKTLFACVVRLKGIDFVMSGTPKVLILVATLGNSDAEVVLSLTNLLRTGYFPSKLIIVALLSVTCDSRSCKGCLPDPRAICVQHLKLAIWIHIGHVFAVRRHEEFVTFNCLISHQNICSQIHGIWVTAWH